MDLDHPKTFKAGTRVLTLVSRNKDVGQNKTHKQYVTLTAKEFDVYLGKLREMRQEGQRIYSTASSLHRPKAVRKFREAQLQSEFDQDPYAFYMKLEAKWVSCLMKSEDQKRWLFDCDTDEEVAEAMIELYDREEYCHDYKTKRGFHIITKPFNFMEVSYKVRLLLHKNPLMLWSY